MRITVKNMMLMICLAAVLGLTACNVLPVNRSESSSQAASAGQDGLAEQQAEQEQQEPTGEDAWGAEHQKDSSGQSSETTADKEVPANVAAVTEADPAKPPMERDGETAIQATEHPEPAPDAALPEKQTDSTGAVAGEAVGSTVKASTPVPEKRSGKRPDALKAQSWYYMKQGQGKVPRFPVTAWFEPEQQVRWVGTGKTVYLTFDNGGGMGDIDTMLNVMDEFGVKASFFITGNNIIKHPDSIRKLTAAGHLVLNHSMTHRDFTKLDDEAVLQEIRDTQKAIETVTGKQAPKCFRFPYGRFTSRQLDMIAAEGYRTYFWSTAMKDWIKRENGWKDAYNDVINNLHDGNIILMHQASEENTEALDDIIRTILDKGYRFGLVDEL